MGRAKAIALSPPTDLEQHVLTEIRVEMARQRMTQEVLAERLGILRQSVSHRLSGKVSLRLDELVAIATALGVPIDRLMNGLGS